MNHWKLISNSTDDDDVDIESYRITDCVWHPWLSQICNQKYHSFVHLFFHLFVNWMQQFDELTSQYNSSTIRITSDFFVWCMRESCMVKWNAPFIYYWMEKKNLSHNFCVYFGFTTHIVTIELKTNQKLAKHIHSRVVSSPSSIPYTLNIYMYIHLSV